MTKLTFIVKSNQGIEEFNNYNEALIIAAANEGTITQHYEEIDDGELYLLKFLDLERFEEIIKNRTEHQNKMNLRNDRIFQVG